MLFPKTEEQKEKDSDFRKDTFLEIKELLHDEDVVYLSSLNGFEFTESQMK